jgi:hypothetical protein
MNFVRAVLLCGLCIVLTGVSLRPVSAQTRSTGGDVHGVVEDTSKGRLPGVTVTVRNIDTNITRIELTDAEGRYRLAALEPGDYEVAVELAGFTVGPPRPLRVQVGDVLDVPFEMRPANVAETVVVTASEPVVQPTRTTVSTVLAEEEIDQLPLNGRRFVDLAALAAGVTPARPDPTAETSGLSFLGQRPVSNSLLVDGLDNNDRILGGATASFTQESIREFRVLTASYPAEFGSATGGVVNIVTRSGTNTLHGSAFLYYRDQALNARGLFEGDGSSKAPFQQAQFGGSAGGPLVRDRTFVFAALERRETDASNAVTIDSGIAALLSASGSPVELGHVPYQNDLGQVFGRLDHYWRAASSLAIRFQLSDSRNENYAAFGGLTARSRSATTTRRDWGLAGTQTNVIGSAWVHEARAQITRQRHLSEPADATGPAVSLLGIANVGRAEFYPTDRTAWTFQAKDSIARAGRRHSFKAGVDLTRIDQQALLSYTFGGSYVFAALPPIPGLLPTGLSAPGAFLAGLPAVYIQGYGSGESPFEYTDTSGFVQDDWRVTERLTVKGGLRFQRQDFPDFTVNVSDLGGARLSYPFPLSAGHVSPRAALSFDPSGDGRTVVHGAYGLFFGEQLTSVYGVTNVFGRTDGTRLDVYPFPLSAAAWQAPGHRLPEGALPAVPVTITVGPDAGTPRVHQASAGVARDFSHGLSATIDVVYSRGSHQLGAIDYNPVVPALGSGRRPNDVAGIAGTSASTVHYTDFGDTWYRGVLVSLSRTHARHSLRASYTWGHAEDNAARFAGLVDDNGRGRNPQDPTGLPLGFDPDREKGPAETDQPHRFVASGRYDARGGLTIAGIFSAASGLPFTPLAGADLNGDGIPDSDRARRVPADASTAVGRNSERLPAQVALDLRVSRQLRLASGVTLTPMLEAFNVFNRTNVSDVNAVFGTGAYPAEPLLDAQGRSSFGRTQQTLAPRQIQLAARLSF